MKSTMFHHDSEPHLPPSTPFSKRQTAPALVNNNTATTTASPPSWRAASAIALRCTVPCSAASCLPRLLCRLMPPSPPLVWPLVPHAAVSSCVSPVRWSQDGPHPCVNAAVDKKRLDVDLWQVGLVWRPYALPSACCQAYPCLFDCGERGGEGLSSSIADNGNNVEREGSASSS